MSAIEPTIWTEAETIREIMTDVGVEAAHQNLWNSIGCIVAIGIGKEVKIGRSQRKHSIVDNLDTGELLEFVVEDRPFIEGAVFVSVFEDHDAIIEIQIQPLSGLGVGIVFGDPQATFHVPGHCDRLLDEGFGRSNLHAETLWKPRGRSNVGRRHSRYGFGL
jgi:hypothetical protein